MYKNRHGGVRSAAVAEAYISRESKVGRNILEWCSHLMCGKKRGKIIAVSAIKAYISKSILPTYIRFSHAQSLSMYDYYRSYKIFTDEVLLLLKWYRI